MPLMSETKISVIIPVYNVEKHIYRCIESLFAQTMKEGIEFIFVNDCTSDNSMQIIHNFINKSPERKNAAIIVNHLQNMGLPSARNSGLKIAKGDFIIHCDSDDWISSNTYETLYNKAMKENADIVCCDFYDEYSNRRIWRREPYPENGRQCIKDMLTTRLHGSVCNKLVRRSLYEKNHITFPDGINLWEDLYTSIRLFFFAEKIAYVPLPLYHYNQQNTASLLSSVTLKKMEERIRICDMLADFFKAQESYGEFEKELNQRKLWAKMEFITDDGLRDFNRWNALWPESSDEIWSRHSPLTRLNRIIASLVHNRHYSSGKVLLDLKRAAKKIIKD